MSGKDNQATLLSRFGRFIGRAVKNTLYTSGFTSMRLESGTAEYPTTKDVLDSSITYMLRGNFADRVVLSSNGTDSICKIRWQGIIGFEYLVVSFSYPFSKSPLAVLPDMGISLPGLWKPGLFWKKKWARYRIDKCPADESADVLDSIFIRLYGCPPDHILCAKIDRPNC